MKNLLFQVMAVGSVFCLSCSTSPQTNQESSVGTPSVMADSVTPEAKNIGRKFIKKIATQLEVRDVSTSTQRIEQEVETLGGYVASSFLESRLLDERKIRLSEDSILLAKKLEVTNEMVVKIPAKFLNGFMKILHTEAINVQKRSIEMEDVSLKLLGNQLDIEKIEQQKRSEPNSDEVHLLLEANQRRIDNLRLKEDVNFNTISISLSQKPVIQKQKILNPDLLDDLDTPLGRQIIEALQGGWELMWSLLLLLLLGWLLLPVGMSVWYFWRKKMIKS